MVILLFIEEPACHWPFLTLVNKQFCSAVHAAIPIYDADQWRINGLPPAIHKIQPKRTTVVACLDGVFHSSSRLLYTINNLVPYNPWLASNLQKNSTTDACVQAGLANFRRSISEYLEMRHAAETYDSVCGARFSDAAIISMAKCGSESLIRRSFFELMSGVKQAHASLAYPHYMALVRALASEGRCDILLWLVQQNPSWPCYYPPRHGINMLLHALVCKDTRTQQLWEQLIAVMIVPAVKHDRVNVLRFLQSVTAKIAETYTDRRARGFLMTRETTREAVKDAIHEWGDIVRYCSYEAARNNCTKSLEFLYDSCCKLRSQNVESINVDLRILVLACAFGAPKRYGNVSEWAQRKIREDGYVRLTLPPETMYKHPDYESFTTYVADFAMNYWPDIIGKTQNYTAYVMRVHDYGRVIFQSSDSDHLDWVIKNTFPGGWLWRTWKRCLSTNAAAIEDPLTITSKLCQLASRTARQRIASSSLQHDDTDDYYGQSRSPWMKSPRIAGPNQTEATLGNAVERWIIATMDKSLSESDEECYLRLKDVRVDLEWVLLFRDLPIVAYSTFKNVCNRYFDNVDVNNEVSKIKAQRKRIMREIIIKAVIPSIGENLTRVLQTLPAFTALLAIANNCGMIEDSEKLTILLSVDNDYDVYNAIAESLGLPFTTADQWECRQQIPRIQR